MNFTSFSDRLLSAHELGFVDLSVSNRTQHVAGVVFLDGTIAIQILRSRVREFIRDNPLYQCRISRGPRPSWQLCHSVRMEDHVTHATETLPHRSAVVELASNTAAQDFEDAPPWRVQLVEFCDPTTNRTRHAVIFHGHHSLVDGIEGMRFLECLIDGKKAVANPSIPLSTTRNTIARIRNRIANARTFMHSALRDLRRRSDRSPISATATSEQRVTLLLEIPRKSVQAGRRVLRSSTQELLLAVISEVLGEYCVTQGYSGNLCAVLPYGRPAGAKADSTNRHDVGFVTLPKNSKEIRVRVDNIRGQVEMVRTETEARVFPRIIRLLGNFPRSLRAHIVHRWARQGSTLISLLPCGRSRASIDHTRIESICILPAIPPSQALSVGVAFNKDCVSVVFNIDPASITNLELLKECVQTAFKRLNSFPQAKPESACPNDIAQLDSRLQPAI